jgi:Flp pilus assembly protein TadD
MGNYEDAISDFNAVIEKNPESPSAYALVADAYLNLEKNYEARMNYKKALELDPEDKKALKGLEMLDDFSGVRRF